MGTKSTIFTIISTVWVQASGKAVAYVAHIGYIPGMTLKEYLDQTETTVDSFRAQIGAKSRTTIYRYMDGRLPNKTMMRRIVAATDGKVQPNDFFASTSERGNAA